jgi:hypothetical protein
LLTSAHFVEINNFIADLEGSDKQSIWQIFSGELMRLLSNIICIEYKTHSQKTINNIENQILNNIKFNNIDICVALEKIRNYIENTSVYNLHYVHIYFLIRQLSFR